MLTTLAPPRLTDTLTELLRPRRAVPIGFMAVVLVVGQVWFTPDIMAVWLAIVLVTVFLVVGPHAWRRLFGEARVDAAIWARMTLFVGLGLMSVTLFGWALPRGLGLGNTFLSAPGSLLVEPALFWVGAWGLGRDIELEGRADRMTRAAEDAQLLALRSHLDPHFLFNTLNALAEWCRIDPALAEEGILSLSRLLRSIFEAVRPGEAKPWTLGDEVDLAERLFALHALRDPGAIQVEVAIDPALRTLLVPPLLILPLAENAMKHGIGKGARGRVTLTANAVDDAVEVAVESPGVLGVERPGGHGLEVTRRRLAHLHPASRLTLTAAVDALDAVDAVGDASPRPTSRTRATLTVPRHALVQRGR